MNLVADMAGADWALQPAPGLAHPLWICGHLACAQDLLVHVRVLCTSGVLDESFTRHFPIGARIKSCRGHDYPPVETVLDAMKDVHARTLEAVNGMSDELLAEPCFGGDGKPHPYYRDKAGAVAHCSRHEAFHAGQIATIRRILGKPFLR